LSGWRLTGFEELYELGSGAQGRVVLARRAGTGEMVAIKYLAPELLGDPRHKAMFRDEVNMLVRVADPHVARLYEYVETSEGADIEVGPSRSTFVDPAAAGAQAEGSLPRIRILS
jgi:serine/threonine protein kinase